MLDLLGLYHSLMVQSFFVYGLIFKSVNNYIIV